MKLRKIIRYFPYMPYDPDEDGAYGGGDDSGRLSFRGDPCDPYAGEKTYAAADPVWAFLSSFIMTLLLISLAAGLLYVDKSAREAAGAYETAETQAKLIQLMEGLSSLRWTVRGIFPYFIFVVELLLLLCRLFSVIAKAIL